MESLDNEVLRAYAGDLQGIENAKRLMESEVATYRHEHARDPFYSDDKLRISIQDNLHKLYILLGCAVRQKHHSYDDLDRELGRFGFKLGRTTSQDSTGGLKIVGMGIATAVVLLLGLAATEVGYIELWSVSPVYPQKLFQPILDSIAILIPHCVAIMVADLIRTRALSRGRWFPVSHRSRSGIGATYIKVAVVCGVAGYAVLVLWGLAFQSLTAKGLLIDAPNILLAMATGGFYLYHLDNAELHRRPSRLFELASQTIVTGLCGLIASAVSFELIFGSPGIAIDRIVLNTLCNAAVGFVLAWYVPEAAAERFDPLADAREERVRTLLTEAQAKFGSDDVARAWLDSPKPALGNRSPRAAAADLEGFEQAAALLQGPKAVAA
jgi:uncharacterized protein (DUF2384 family)